MKSKESGSRGSNGVRRPPRIGTGDIRMEWMDPVSWRLPSGKALAEFALQAGFLAPLMLVGPRFKKVKKSTVAPGEVTAADKNLKEVPERSGTFRETE